MGVKYDTLPFRGYRTTERTYYYEYIMYWDMHNHTDTYSFHTITHIIISARAFSQAHNIAIVPQGHTKLLCHFVSLISFFRSTFLK